MTYLPTPEGFEDSTIKTDALEQISSNPDSTLTRWQLTVDDVILKIEENLRGRRFIQNDDGTRGYIKFGEPLMSEMGIREVSREVKMRINKISFLSNLDENHINEITGNLQMNLADRMFDNWEAWGIPAEAWNEIIDSLGDLVFMGLRKALDDGERKTLRIMERRLERVQPATGNDKAGVLNTLFK